LTQPEHVIHDDNGIKNLIPEKLPKIGTEEYKEVYKQIDDAFNNKLSVTTKLAYEDNLVKFMKIAKQFYYDDIREDFNNSLLIEDYKNINKIEQKNDLFERLQIQLKDFYDDTNEIDEEDLKNRLNENLNKNIINLNTNITNMRGYNVNVFNAIKKLATSLELSTHYFFLKNPENTYIATEVVIAIAERAFAQNPVNKLLYITLALQSLNVAREAVQAVKAATIEVSKERNLTKEVINVIRTYLANTVTTDAVLVVAEATGPAGTVGNAILGIPGVIIPLIPLSPPIAGGKANNIRNKISVAIALPPLVAILQPALALVGVSNNIQRAYSEATFIPIYVALVKKYTNDAITPALRALLAIPATPENQVQLIAILQTVTRAAVYASVYAQNIKPVAVGQPPPQVANLSAVHAAVEASVIAGVKDAVAAAVPAIVANQEQIQIAFTDPVVAIEAVVRAANEVVKAVNAIRVTPATMISALREALENIEASKENIDIIIAIAEEARANAEAPGVTDRVVRAAIARKLGNVSLVREAIQAVRAIKAATINESKAKYIINLIRTEVVIAVASDTLTPTSVSDAVNNAEAGISKLISNPPNTESNNIAKNITDNVRNAIVRPTLVLTLEPAFTPPNVGRSIQDAAINSSLVVTQLNSVEKKTRKAISTALGIVIAPPLTLENQVQLIAILQSVTRASVYASVYAQNITQVVGLPAGRLPPLPLPPLPLPPPQVANLAAVHAAVEASVLAGVQAAAATAVPSIVANQEQIQIALSDQVVAIEAVVRAAKEVVTALYNISIYNIGVTADIMKAALREALTQPQIIPQYLKNKDYNELIKSYKLINIPQKYINYNISYKYDENNIKEATELINYKLPEGDRSYGIDYFNLLYTFNEYVKDNYNPLANIDSKNIFNLYQHIQQIYKYNYIIYIFEKEKDNILKLKDNYISDIDNINLKRSIDSIFEKSYLDLVNSVSLIRNQLEIIKNLANDYIDNYNKLNGYKIYTDESSINIGIYPKINFPDIDVGVIKYKLGDENAIIAKCNDYITYNKYKNNFFHNFVLYFQDIGVYNSPPGLAENPLNRIPKPINYNIAINTHNTNIIDNKDKAYKLYFYDSIYLKLEKQKIVDALLNDEAILQIKLQKYDYFNSTLSKEFNKKQKIEYLHKILEDEFNKILVSEINNFFKMNLSINNELFSYNTQIKEPDFNKILLSSLGFQHILAPNYEFTNNKFLSISKNKNKFLSLTLFFDTHYFKQTNLKQLKYYKDNQFITEILKNNKSLLLKTDTKDWTPIYYAIDGNNYDVIINILFANVNTLIHYDHKEISPLMLCINKQLNHLNYLLTENNKIHYLNNYIKMLKNELKSNEILIPLNIDAVFIIALFIQNHIWNTQTINLDNSVPKNTRKTQINKEYNSIDTQNEDVDNDKFKHGDNVDTSMNKPDRPYKKYSNEDYNYNIGDDNNTILQKYYTKAKELEGQDFGLYGSYWINWKTNKILTHINQSIQLKQILKKLKKIEKTNPKFNLPYYDKKTITDKIAELNKIKDKLEDYLKFINIRFNTNTNNAYDIFLKKIYVHVLANIIGVDLYLRMEELIVNHYINSGIGFYNNNFDIKDLLNEVNIKEQLKPLNQLLINNKLDSTNINYLYITEPIPESVLKNKIKEFLENSFLPNKIEIINIFETTVLPKYRDLYKITYKFLQMFISNYHKFIYNQYHGLEILLLLLEKLLDISS
jgi:hypothetical protein